jgi:PAS domain S-box-containing protein
MAVGDPGEPGSMGFERLEHYRDLVNLLPDIIYQIDRDGNFQFVGSAISLLDYTPAELVGKHFSILLHPDDLTTVSYSLEQERKNPAARAYFDEHRTKSRLLETAEIRLIPKRVAGEAKRLEPESFIYGELSARGAYEVEESSGKKVFLGSIGVIRDITRRKKAEGLLRKLLWAVDQTPVSIVITGNDGVIDYINPEFIRTSGHVPQDVIGRNVRILKSHYHPAEFYTQIGEALAANGEWSGEIINKKKNGKYYWTSVMISAVRDPQGVVTNYISIQEDITEKKRTTKQIKALREKEILLREIHHRVKNNLQIITSLINLQSEAIKEQRFVDVFKKCENRIKTLALIHEKLYQSHDIARIEFGDYVKSLLFQLMQAHREKLERIKIEVEVEKIYFDIDTAIPAGLIINELVTNAFFHAFPGGRKGEIRVLLHEKDGHYVLEIGNDGIEMQKDIDVQSGGELGLQLVRVLVKQLGGTLMLNKKPRTLFKIIIPMAG